MHFVNFWSFAISAYDYEREDIRRIGMNNYAAIGTWTEAADPEADPAADPVDLMRNPATTGIPRAGISQCGWW